MHQKLWRLLRGAGQRMQRGSVCSRPSERSAAAQRSPLGMHRSGQYAHRRRPALAPLCVKGVTPGLDSVPRSSPPSSRLRLTASPVRCRWRVPGGTRGMGWLSWRKVVGGGSGK